MEDVMLLRFAFKGNGLLNKLEKLLAKVHTHARKPIAL